MKIAVCLYGQPRFAETGPKYLMPFLQDLNPDFFIHSWGSAETYESLKKLYNPIEIKVEPQKTDFAHLNDIHIDTIRNAKGFLPTISPLFSMFEVGKLLEQNSNSYDFVVITRTDIAMVGKPLKELLKNKNTIYSSYVPGDMWVIKKENDSNIDLNHVDLKLICSNKETIIYLTKLYSKLKTYHTENSIPICHHRLMYFHLKQLNLNFEMLNLNENCNFGGWFLIRDNKLSPY